MNLSTSLLSGSFAALASVFGKLAFNDSFSPLVRLCALLSLLACNACMLTFFVRALRDAGSVIGTTVNACANVGMSAFLGVVFFDELEKLTTQWMVGAAVALVGMFCLVKGSQMEKIEKMEKVE
jgi:uncharacterized membrane protein